MPGIPPRTCNRLSGLIRELGLDTILVDEMLPSREFHRFSGEEQRRRAEVTLERLVTAFDLRNLSLLVGSRSDLEDRPMLLVAARAAPTLAEALDRILRYRSIWDRSVPIQLVGAGGGRPRLELQTEGGGSVGSQVLRESVLVALLQSVRALASGPVRPRRVCFAHAAPEPSRAFEEFFGAPVVYRAACDAIEFGEQTFSARLPGADPIVSELALSHLDSLAESSAAELASLARRARSEVSARLERGLPTVGQLARALGLSDRTLRRRLEREGSSYARIVDSVRRERAYELLAITKRPVTEIGFDLGFAHPSAFSRAFRRWRAEGPSTYRARFDPDRSRARASRRERPRAAR